MVGVVEADAAETPTTAMLPIAITPATTTDINLFIFEVLSYG
jgi:hypothetical protein